MGSDLFLRNVSWAQSCKYGKEFRTEAMRISMEMRVNRGKTCNMFIEP